MQGGKKRHRPRPPPLKTDLRSLNCSKPPTLRFLREEAVTPGIWPSVKHGTKIKNKVVATTPPDAKAKSTPKIKTGGTVRTRRVVSDDVPKRRQFQSRVGALAASRAKNESMPQTISGSLRVQQRIKTNIEEASHINPRELAGSGYKAFDQRSQSYTFRPRVFAANQSLPAQSSSSSRNGSSAQYENFQREHAATTEKEPLVLPSIVMKNALLHNSSGTVLLAHEQLFKSSQGSRHIAHRNL